MAKINLLPWRDAQRQEKKKEFFTVLGGFCILGALCSFVWISSVNGAIDNQNSRNARLDSEIKALEQQVKEIQDLKKQKAELLRRMEVIQSLQGTRPIIVRYVDELARAVPDGVFFKSVERTNNLISINGVTESNERLASLMRKLESSPWFKDTSVINIGESNRYGEGWQEFRINTSTDAPKEEQAAKGGA